MSTLQDLTQRDLLPLLDEVCAAHHVTRAEICSRGRTRTVSLARQDLWWRLRNHQNLAFSYVELGRLFDRNHSTILQGVRAWEKFMDRRRRHPGTAVTGTPAPELAHAA